MIKKIRRKISPQKIKKKESIKKSELETQTNIVNKNLTRENTVGNTSENKKRRF